ncbi:MAG: SIS domain-containing protein [Planctomycetota bacterium]|jgi:arabinose-5-phosphate isomerase|nr:SIS domain-containing protein [Planctomycetota bacterium]
MTKPELDQMLAKARAVVATEAGAVAALEGQLNADFVTVARMMLECKGHILTAGAGTSCAMAQRFAHLLACCGTPALFISAANSIHGGAGAISDKDIVYIISKGGQSAEINTFAQIAKDRGARVIAHTEKPDSPLGKLSDAVVRVTAPQSADPYGMIATGSSLMNGAACDVLCVLLLELRGYTKEQFGHTHPGGAVGVRIEAEKRGQ